MPQDSEHLITADSHSIFRGGGEMGDLMRAYNWEAHPLGNPDAWPQSLKANIRIIMNSGFPMFIWWSEELYIFYNDAYIPALGKKHPKALGSSAREVWAEIWGQLQDIVEDILKGGDPFYTENLLLYLERKGYSEETYWTFSYSAAFNDTGEIQGIFCACYEVTATVLGQRRVKALRDMADAFHQMKTLEEACQLCCERLYQNNRADLPFSLIYLLDENGQVAHCYGKAGVLSPAYAPGAIRLEAANAPWPLAQVQQSGQQVLLDLQDTAAVFGEAADGSVLPQKAVVWPVYKPGQSRLIGFFISGISPSLPFDAVYESFYDLLTSQLGSAIVGVQAREESIRQQKFLNDVFQQAPVGITILRGSDYIVELANPGICELWRRKHADVLGKPLLTEVLPEVRDQGIQELLDGVYYTGVPYVNTELALSLERNGKPDVVYVSFVYHPIRDAQGIITGIIAIAIDIHEQVMARQEIEAMNKRLRTTNADLDNFVYAASHDLKAPISNIEGLMQALINQLPAETQQSYSVKRLTEYIQASVDRFKRSISDLTQVAKIQREAGEDLSPVDLTEIIEEVVLDFETTIEAIDARVDVAIVPHTKIMHLSAKNVRSTVYNLISNSLKYSDPGRTPHIRIATETTAEYTMLSVADNGLGIDMAKESKIFSMFKRLHDHVDGSGVGLYIVKKIVENAGGKIEVESQVGAGATFKVYFKN